jgi:hypothetical protein
MDRSGRSAVRTPWLPRPRTGSTVNDIVLAVTGGALLIERPDVVPDIDELRDDVDDELDAFDRRRATS